jgi:hypothetical protein
MYVLLVSLGGHSLQIPESLVYALNHPQLLRQMSQEKNRQTAPVFPLPWDNTPAWLTVLSSKRGNDRELQPLELVHGVSLQEPLLEFLIWLQWANMPTG